ncbi:MAG: polymorphic toxin-type HINT domain-containing protein [Micromonosporaceae bacterium]
MVTSLAIAAVLISVAQVPAWATPETPFTPSKPKPVPKVQVQPVKPAQVTAKPMPDSVDKPAPVWPAAGTGIAKVPAQAGSAAVRAGTLPVLVGRPHAKSEARTEAPDQVRVEMLDRARTDAAGVRGVLLRVARADGEPDAAAVDVTVDYRRFRTAYGGDWSTRLRLVALPECALATPAKKDCIGTPLPSVNSPSKGTVKSRVEIGQGTASGSGATLLAVTAGSSGQAGDFTATSLQSSSTWSAGGSAGDFSWSYEMRVPPVSAGPAPSLSLNYSAQSVDGRHAASNNQPSGIGEGFELSAGGYIERRYVSCADDMDNGANNTQKTGDQCWVRNNATLSLAGHSGELIYNSTQGRWHLRGDDGSRVERKTGAANGDADGEYWVVTTTDGTQYWFGAHRLPGWTTGKPVTNSTWTVPVYGNHAGEPCHATAFKDSSCAQAWRWNLDYVIDVHGNSTSHWYTKDTNKYAANLTAATPVGYVRDGYLDHISYATRRVNGADSVFVAAAPARVDFGMADRCLSSCTTHDEVRWPDTPWDQECAGATCQTYSPTFWSTRRLSTVTTKTWNGTSYDSVERWTLTHTFPDPGDGTRAGLWLSKLSHQGLVGTAVSIPDIEFTGVQLNNRVDTVDFAAAMNWWRIARIRSETGGTLDVVYSDRDCIAGTRVPTAPASNTLRCYPVRWTPEGYTAPVTDYFHKYVVTAVYEADNTGGVPPNGSPRVAHTYSYIGSPAWHYTDDDGLIEEKNKTWSVWRGYEKVAVVDGDPGEQTYTETKYFRGMHGDKAATGTRTVTVTGTGVPTVNDEDAYAGMARETTVRNGPGGAVVSAEVFEPWQSNPTATRTINGDTVTARFTDIRATHQRITLDGGRGTRVRTKTNTFDAYGMTIAVDDTGDTAVTGDENCTKTTYEPRNTGAWLLNASHRSLALAVPCAAASDLTTLTADDVISDTRVYFDGQAPGAAPVRGLSTTTEEAIGWNAGVPTYETVSRTAYDADGRATSSWDAFDYLTTTAYTPASGGLVTKTVVTNPLNHVTTTTLHPAWGLATSVVDPNGKRTDVSYDAFGRTAAVWQPGRDKDTQTANTTFSYQLRNNAPSAVTTSALNAAGNQITRYDLFDGLLRQRQTQSPSPSGGRLLTDVFYDTAGRTVREHGSYYTSGAPGTTLSTAVDRQDVPNQTRTEYDGAGRTLASIFQPYTTERWRTTTSYGGDRVNVTPPAGGTATTTITDAYDRTVALRQYEAATPTGAYDETRYDHNRKGQLVTVTDPTGLNSWNYTYDLRGQRLTATDPDTGTTTNTYEKGGRLRSTTDALGNTLIYTYDQLHRRTAVIHSGVGTRARWVYDTSAKGQLYQAIRFLGTANYTRRITSYDDAYRPKDQLLIVPSSETGLAGTYSLSSYHNVDGSLSSIDYAAAGDLPLESVSYHYDPVTGLPTDSVGGAGSIAESYVYRTDYNALGEVDQYVLYAGKYTGLGSRVYRSFTRELETGRLTGSRTDRQSLAPYVVNNTTYQQDDAGNITKIADVANGDFQCYQHDHLRRLTQAWTPSSNDCSTAPDNAALAGPAPYRYQWSYDKTGNRTQQIRYATQPGGNNTTTTYSYPAAGTTQPHTLSSTTTTVGSDTTTDTYTYDDAGNSRTRPGINGTLNLTWDPEGHLATSTDDTGATSYLYDADGNRLISRDPTGKTLYLPGQELRYDNASATSTCTRYYMFNGETIASRTAAGLTWLSNDHQGTAVTTIDEKTQESTTRRRAPFGDPRGPVITHWVNNQGFVGGTDDNTGLTHLGAREYDATTGRFISVDPIIDYNDPQMMNGYAYANNSPITLADPDGLKVTECQSGCTGSGGLGDTANNTKGDGYRSAQGRGWQRLTMTIASSHAFGGDKNDLTPDEVTALYRPNTSYSSLSPEDQRQMLVNTICINFGNSSKECKAAELHRNGRDFGAGDAALMVGLVLGNLLAFELGIDVGAVYDCAGGDVSGCAAAVTPFMLGRALRLGAKLAFARKACNSFTPGTLVLMADGSYKPIEEVQIGDEVVTTDPESGETGIKMVADLIVGSGLKNLVEITIDTDGDRGEQTGTITSTDNHPFWVVNMAKWVNANSLRTGDILSTPTGDAVNVINIQGHVDYLRVHNLTVDEIHTYYVAAGDSFVLVHNDGGWTIDPAKSTAVMRGGPFGAMYYQQVPDSKGNIYWWSPDKAGHGGSAWKVYRETATGLEWVADADANGDFMKNKYKGNTGKSISFKDLKTVNVKGLGSALGGC